MTTIRLAIQAAAPFDFDLTAGVHSRFAHERVNCHTNGRFRRAFVINDRPLVADLRSTGSTEAPSLELVVAGPGVSETEAEILAGRLRFMFGVDDDTAGFHRRASGDPVLAHLTARLRGLRSNRWPSLHELLVGAVTSQQITLSFAAIIKGRLVERFGRAVEYDGETLWTFPEPEALASATVGELMAMQSSRRKAEYLIDISAAIARGDIDETRLQGLSDEDVITSLTQHRGLGRWSAEWALIRAFGRPDALPVDDVGVQRAVATYYGVTGPDGRKATPAQVAEIGQRWRPFRAIAVHHLLTALRIKEPPE